MFLLVVTYFMSDIKKELSIFARHFRIQLWVKIISQSYSQ